MANIIKLPNRDVISRLVEQEDSLISDEMDHAISLRTVDFFGVAIMIPDLEQWSLWFAEAEVREHAENSAAVCVEVNGIRKTFAIREFMQMIYGEEWEKILFSKDFKEVT